MSETYGSPRILQRIGAVRAGLVATISVVLSLPTATYGATRERSDKVPGSLT